MVSIHHDLKSMYDTQYSDKSEQWRAIGAIGKAQNIVDITRCISFNTVIDVGAGDGNVLSVLSRVGFCSDMAAAEISGSAIEQMKKKNIAGLNEIQQFDGYTLPFGDKQFDLAICSHVIEHVEYPRILLAEIKRISKYQVFEVPIDFSLHVDHKFKHFNAYGHINIYTPALFNYLLYTMGFEILDRRHTLYDNRVILFQHKAFSPAYIKFRLKKAIWNLIPGLMRLKPNAYTVLCR
jgi:ubiquinone/menaquinone biosynthesis C-methylase UbiE